jgi:hypothetical protein
MDDPLKRRHTTLCNPPFLNVIVAVPSLDTFAATASTFFNRSHTLAMSLAFTTRRPQLEEWRHGHPQI